MKAFRSSLIALSLTAFLVQPVSAGWFTRGPVQGSKKVIVYRGQKPSIGFAARSGERALSRVSKIDVSKFRRPANDNHVKMTLPKKTFDPATTKVLTERSAQGKLVRSENKRGAGFREALIKAKGPPPKPKMDADHTVPLSLGGKDNARTNGGWKDAGPNRAEGGFYGRFFKQNKVPYGTRIKAESE